jgi:probable rRNA maturation factor
MSSSDPRGMSISVCGADGRAVPAPGLARWLAGVAPRHAQGSVAVVLVTDARMRALNRTWRGVDRPTDVLSFPMQDGAPLDGRPAVPHLGDIVIARGTAARQARALGHPLATELRVLALHGLLHLLGHDHERDRGRMARLEARLRRRGGLREGLIARSRKETTQRTMRPRAVPGARS